MSGIAGKQLQDLTITSQQVDGSVLSTGRSKPPPADNFDALGKRIENLADPLLPQDAATQAFVLAQTGSAHASFNATCDPSLSVGSLAFIVGAALGVPAVAQSTAANVASLPARGIVTQKASPTDCTVQVLGAVTISGLSLIPGATYWLGIAGELAEAVPQPFGESIGVQSVGFALSEHSLFMQSGSPVTVLPG